MRLSEAFREQSGERDLGAYRIAPMARGSGGLSRPPCRAAATARPHLCGRKGSSGWRRPSTGKIDLEPGAATLPRPPHEAGRGHNVIPAVRGRGARGGGAPLPRETVSPGESAVSTGQPQTPGRSGILEAGSCLASVSPLVRAGPGEPCGRNLGISKRCHGGQLCLSPFRRRGGAAHSVHQVLRGACAPDVQTPVGSPEVPPASTVHAVWSQAACEHLILISLKMHLLQLAGRFFTPSFTEKGAGWRGGCSSATRAGQKSLFPLGQETGSECAGEIGGQSPRTIETPSRGEGELRQGPGGGRLTSPLQCTVQA